VQLLGSTDPADALRRLAEERAVLVSEPLARKGRLMVGDAVTVRGPDGPLRFAVAGVYRDYGAERGALLMDLRRIDEVLGPGPLTNVALHLKAGRDVDATVDRLRTELAADALLIRSNRRLRQDVLSVFEQTFAVTRLLQAMSLLVAVAGIALSLLVLARERSSEVALYRALGAGRGQIFRLFVGRALGIALAGELLGAIGGVGLALVLVLLINPAWFGWSIALHWPWTTLASQSALLLVAAVAASLYPAARASRTPATELSRDAL
jgi:putative ABC transport system permease protein